jgi:hypothetical protein
VLRVRVRDTVMSDMIGMRPCTAAVVTRGISNTVIGSYGSPLRWCSFKHR